MPEIAHFVLENGEKKHHDAGRYFCYEPQCNEMQVLRFGGFLEPCKKCGSMTFYTI